MDKLNLLPHLFEGAYIVDENREIIEWNPRCEAITGYTRAEVIGKKCYDNILRHITDTGQQLCHDGCPLLSSINENRVCEATVYLHHKEGYRVPVSVRTIPYYDEVSKKKMAVELFTDILTESTVYLENKELKEKVTIDPLTKVYNKGFIDYQMDICIKEFETFKTNLGLLFIDIDHFKAVNDTYGHDIGDDILKIVATTLALNVRKNDYVGRFGGEEFVVLLRDSTESEMKIIAEKLRLLIEGTAFDVDAPQSLHITISIGCTMLKAEQTKRQLIKQADQNMYKAKKEGRNKVVML